MGFTFIKTERRMMAIGRMICNMVREKRRGMTGRSMKEPLSMVRNMGWVCTGGLMARFMKGLGRRIRSLVRAFTRAQMGELLRVIGKII